MSNNSEKVLKHSIFSIKTSMIFTMVISILSIGFVIFSFFFSNRIIQILQEEIPFKIILKDSSSKDVIDLMNFLKDSEEVDASKTQFIEKDLAAEELKQKLGNDFLAPLNNENPLPDVVNLYVKSDYHNFQTLDNLKNKIESQSIVSSVIFPLKITDRLTNLKSKILFTSSIVSFCFLVFSIILIYNNIRLTIYSNRFNLKVMQLVGATKKFIKKPFLYRSVLDGLIAGIFSNIILVGIIFSVLYITFESNQILIEKTLNVFSLLEISLFMICIIFFGILISFISHWIVLRKILSLKINLYK